jgi:acyl-coenzyme A synthetase/AMP-(fatty) acid ligase
VDLHRYRLLPRHRRRGLSAIARFKRPKDYVFVAALPKNNYGKILKTELRDMDAKRGER